MEGTGAPGGRRRLNAYGRMMRRGRIFARMREGWSYDEIARDEGLTAERIQQIVSEVLQKRLDRYQKTAKAAETYDDEARERLLAKLNQVAERLGYDKILAENARIIAEHEAKVQQSYAEQAAGGAAPEIASDYA